MTYEIQHSTFVDGWINASTTEDADGNVIPLVFATHAEARAELDDYIYAINDQITSGQREPDYRYDSSEFRIREVSKTFAYESMGDTLEFAESLGWSEPEGYPHHDRGWEPDDADGLEADALDHIEKHGYAIQYEEDQK